MNRQKEQKRNFDLNKTEKKYILHVHNQYLDVYRKNDLHLDDDTT